METGHHARWFEQDDGTTFIEILYIIYVYLNVIRFTIYSKCFPVF